MRRFALLFLVLLGCKSEAAKPAPPPPAAPPPPSPPSPPVSLTGSTHESSGLVLAKIDGKLHAFVADEDDSAIQEIDPETRLLVGTTAVGTRPRDLLVLPDGRLAATLPDANAIAIFTRDTTGKLTEAQRVKTPAEPLALATPEKPEKPGALYLTTGASHSLVELDDTLVEKRRVSLGREPRAVLVQGDHVFVTHAIEDSVSVIAKDGTVTTADISNRTTCSNDTHCSSARTARNAQAIVRSGENGLVVPAAQAMPIPARGGSKSILCPKPRPRAIDFDEGDFDAIRVGPKPGPQALDDGGYGFGDGENGPPVTADLAVLDATTGKKWGTGLPPNMGAGCILPRAAVASGKEVFVACLGSARVMRHAVVAKQYEDDAWDAAEHGRFAFDAKGKPSRVMTVNGVHPNLTAAKIDVPAGPTALALGDDADVFVWSQFARTLSVIRKDKAELVFQIPRAVTREEAWLSGRTLFYSNGDDRISKDGRACANCHIDGADDGLAWKTPQGQRRTRFLRGEAARGPYGWNGEHATLAEHIQSTTKNLKGKGLPASDLANLATFVAAMPGRKPVADPAVDHGKALFATAECSHCHSDGGTDRQLHDVGTGGNFKTPTLASIGTRHAIGHSGAYTTIDDMLVHTPNMGRGAELSADDRRALVAYLETL